MESDHSRRTAVLVVTVWMQEPDGFRARMRRTSDVGSPGHVVTATTAPEEVSATVEAWLEEFVGRPLAPSRRRSDDPVTPP